MAQLRRRRQRQEVLAARPDRPRQRPGPPYRVALAVGRSRAGRPRPGAAVQPDAAGHAADDRRPAVHGHQSRAGRGHRPGHRRDHLGLRGAGRRRRASARRLDPRRQLLARPGARRRADLHRERRAARRARRTDRRSVARVRSRRQGQPDGRHPAARVVQLDGGPRSSAATRSSSASSPSISSTGRSRRPATSAASTPSPAG